MAISTYVALATTTLSGGETSVTFSSLPSGYRDYLLIAEVTASGSTGAGVRLNGDSSSSYSRVIMRGTPSGTNSVSATTTRVFLSESLMTSGGKGIFQVHFFDGSATDKHKSILARNDYDRSGYDTSALAGRWANTAAISSIEFDNGGFGAFASGTTLNLFGIEA